jgi:RNA-binding protein NOB1
MFCQNVLLQMGIPVISVDGQIVRQIRTYVLRCFSCMKSVNAVRRSLVCPSVILSLSCRITRDTMRRFCANCGNDTLRRLTVSLDESGKTCYHLAKNRPITTRGTKVWLSLW